MAHQPWFVRQRFKIALVTSCVMLVGTLAGWAYYLVGQFGNVERVALELDENRRPARAGASAKGAMNILLAGADAGNGPSIAETVASGEWKPGSHRSDTMMLLHITANRKKAFLVSVPRDSWVNIPGIGHSKMNAAFSEGGPSLYVQTMEKFTGLRMDHLAIIDWEGFRDLTTAIDGVPVYIPEDIYDPSQKVQWSAGTEELEGNRALQYVRMRYGLENGDFDRIKRQQNFLRAFMKKMLSNGTTTDPIKLTNSVESIVKYLTVDEDFSSTDLRNLAMSLRGLEEKDVTFLTVPQERYDTIDGQSVVIVDKKQTKDLFKAVSNDKLRPYFKEYGREGVLGKAKDVQ
ncbi:MAG TPA: LCP family protein [Nocardioidaceae bacterium]|nr:LCP family protein [Nocardioidaceae bacterium]